MARTMFKDIQEIVKNLGYTIDKHSNKKAKHYTVTNAAGVSTDIHFAGKLSELLEAINAGFETFVTNNTLAVAQAQSKRSVKAAKVELDNKITDLMVRCMKIGIDKKSDEYKTMRQELVDLRTLRGDDMRSRAEKEAEAKAGIVKRKTAKKAARKKSVTKGKA